MKLSARLEALRAGTAPADDEKLPDAAMPGEDDDDDPKTESASKKKDKEPMTTEANDAALAAAKAEGFADASARYNAVLASADYKGRESLALNLLGNAAMSADAIVAALGTVAAPVAAAPAAPAEPDDAKDRADLRAKIAANQPAALGQDAEPEAKISVADVEAGSADMKAAMAKANELSGH